jgi:tetratricopeptide (TPR) repeat protein
MNSFAKIRPVYSGIFIFLIFFLLHSMLMPGDARAGEMELNPLYSKGVAHYHQGEYKRAFVLFYELFREAPGNPEVNFFLGRSAFETGDYETAVFAFERILIAEPGNQRTRLEMARAYWRLGSLEEASRLFKEVLESNPPDAVKANIGPYLLAIEKSRKRHFVNLSVTTGINFDDNVNISPVDDILTVPALDDLPVNVGGAESGYYVPLNLACQHRYFFESFPGYWKNAAQTYFTRYPGHDDLEVDYFYVSTGAGVTWGKFELGLFPEGYMILLDSQRYNQAFGAALKLNYFPGGNQKIDITGFIRDKDFQEDDGRDSLETGIEAKYAFHAGKAVVTPKLYFKQEAADDDKFGYDRYGAGFAVAFPLPYRLNAYSGYSFEYDDYKDEDDLFEAVRRDRTHAITAGVARTFPVTDRFQFLTGIAHTWETVDSSLSLYEYERNVTRIYFSLFF